jgi:hypothetical protein
MLKKLRPRITALDLLLASDKQIFKLPIHDRMLLCNRKLETWVRLVVTPTTVKRGALANAEQHLCDTNYTIPDFLAPA